MFPQYITRGPDYNLWFTEWNASTGANNVARVTPSGNFTQYPVPTANSDPLGIAAGPDGNLWSTEKAANKVAKISPDSTGGTQSTATTTQVNGTVTQATGTTTQVNGTVTQMTGTTTQVSGTVSGNFTEYTVPTKGSQPVGITLGPDGNLWFANWNSGKVSNVSPSGSFTEYVIPGALIISVDITLGPDGNLWFTECEYGTGGVTAVAKVSPSGTLTEYPTPTGSACPTGITLGPDGNLWFTENTANKVAKVTPSGTFTEYPIPTPGSFPGKITAGPDGNLWFIESDTGTSKVANITHSGTFTEYPVPTAHSEFQSSGITTGPDRNMWFTENQANKVAKIILNLGPIDGAPNPLETQGSGSKLEPQVCACEGRVPSRPGQGYPVNSATGNFYHSFTDIVIPGRGIPLAFSHTYNSVSAATDGPLGFGWTSSYGNGMSLIQSVGSATVVQENGAQATFTLSGSTYSAPPRVTATLVKNADGTFTLTSRARQSFTFSAAGQLTSERDLNGYITSFSYNGSGQLVTVTDPAGRTLTLAWSGSHISSVTDQTGRSVLFAYTDGLGNLTDVTDVNGGITHFTYDPNHLLLTMTDPRGGVVTNHYDTSNRVDWQTDPLQRKTLLAYTGDNLSSSGGSTTITDPKGNVTVEQYQFGERLSVTRGAGTPQAATWTYTYDPATLGIISATDPNNHVTTMTYDANANLLTSTDALNRRTVSTYDPLNDLLTTTDPNGVTTTMTYDAHGNLLSKSAPLVGSGQNQVTTYQYTDPAHPGDLTGMVDPNGAPWTYAYDAYGDRVISTDPLGDKTTSAYDTVGRLTATTTPTGNVPGTNPSAYTTKFTYDNFGDLRTSTDPLGHITTREYDPDRNLAKLTDAKNNVTQYTYDLANELKAVTRGYGTPQATTETTDYNPDGAILDQIDGKGNKVSYGYDPLARVTSQIVDPTGLNRVSTSTYDGVGNLLTVTDPEGQVTTRAYDAANELLSVTYSDGKTPNVTSVIYDADGQRTAMTDGTGTTGWTIDSLHRITGSSFTPTGASVLTVGYGYDLKGQLTNLTYPGGLAVARIYDLAGRVKSVQDWLGSTTTFTYDANSNLMTQTVPSTTPVIDTYTHDTADRLMGIADTTTSGTLASFTYTRDNDNYLTSEVAAGSGITAVNDTYAYDPVDRVTSVNKKSYGYDAADEVTRLTSGATLTYDTANELTTDTKGTTSSTFGYDPRGNRTSSTEGTTTTAYGYDQANRLTSFVSGTKNASYVYNGDGLRMSKTVGITKTMFVWDVAQGLPLVLRAGKTSYVYGPGGLPLEQISGSTALFFHHDQLGSTRMLTSTAGAVVASEMFDAYGNRIAKTGTVSTSLGMQGSTPTSSRDFSTCGPAITSQAPRNS
jgi:YD repeat-containing protein